MYLGRAMDWVCLVPKWYSLRTSSKGDWDSWTIPWIYVERGKVSLKFLYERKTPLLRCIYDDLISLRRKRKEKHHKFLEMILLIWLWRKETKLEKFRFSFLKDRTSKLDWRLKTCFFWILWDGYYKWILQKGKTSINTKF